MKAIRLRTEYLKNPIGIDISKPRLFWNCVGGRQQTAYQIIAKSGGREVWNTGKVLSSRMTHILYEGEPLHSRQRIYWSVKLWDENGEGGEISSAFFEMGLLQKTDWKAKWITGNYTVNEKERYPVDCFRKIFTAGEIRAARLYATACGLYEACLNGVKIGSAVLTPGHTSYRKRIQYQTYDVTELLKEGENALTFQLADGWYRGACGASGLLNQYGTETKLLAQLELTDVKGRVTCIYTDGSWQWSNDGSIRFADNKDGEIVNANAEPSYQGKAKQTTNSVFPVASNNVMVEEHETLSATRITTPAGKTVLDFHQNIAGYLSFRLNAKQGQKITLRFGEMLDENGEFTQKNIQNVKKERVSPLQQVIYTCKEGLNEYKTRFAIFGFQYVEVTMDGKVNPEDFTAIAVYSSMERTGWLETSNDLLNKFVESTVWSTKNNHADLPTDCPTRERHGWAGDAQIFCATASFLFSYAPMARKFEKDLSDTMTAEGCYRQIAPEGGIPKMFKAMDGSAGWSDAGVFIPYDIYKQYGDIAILEENYPDMVRYAEYKIDTLGKRYLTARPTGIDRKYCKWISNYGQSYGEWAEPADVMDFSVSEFICPHPEETTAYIVLLMERMSEIAALLGKQNDSAWYGEIGEKVREGYQHLVEAPKFSLDTDRQAKLVRPLHLKLLNEQQTEYAKHRLLKALDNYGWHLGTGFLSTPFILDVLSKMDIAYAYRLLENEEMPGWLCMPKQGATTIWENWEGPNTTKPASLNHYSKGAVCRWIFDTMCGIHVDGENHFAIAPQPGGHVTHAKASYQSLYGMVESGWKRTEDGCEYTVTVPENCTATVRLPDGRKMEQESGTQVYHG
ncbi:MAG: family 78 glycoside hydrolase catalytic domain [Faecousia sp.]